jgi:hypothetical protein
MAGPQQVELTYADLDMGVQTKFNVPLAARIK